MSALKPTKPLLALAIAGLLTVIVCARARFVGSTLAYVTFNASFALSTALMVTRPRSYAYSYFAGLLALGFWFKFLSHLIVGYSFVEPVGAFDETPEAWDRALYWSSTAAVAVAVARCVQLVVVRISRSSRPFCMGIAPQWYVEQFRLVWGVSLTLLALVFVANTVGSIYRIGIVPHPAVPSWLYVIVAWTISLGGALWLASLVYWESLRKPQNFRWATLCSFAEASLASSVALSRSVYLLCAGPQALFAIVNVDAEPAERSRIRRFVSACFVAGFLFSLTMATLTRMVVFSSAESSNSSAESSKNRMAYEFTSDHIRGYLVQTLRLVSDRWIGLEGVLSVTSYPGRGTQLLYAAICEDPRRGSDSYYQLISGSQYTQSKAFTFLTLPGIVGVCCYGGAPIYVFVGLMFATALLMVLEAGCFRWTGNPLLTSLVSLNAAFVVHQMNFPYLTWVFFCELAASIGAIAVLGRLTYGKSANAKFVGGAG